MRVVHSVTADYDWLTSRRAPVQRPFIAKPWEVRAMLENRMTQFRRPMEHIRCPFGSPGDRLWVKETLWISDCKRYFARPVAGMEDDPTAYDVICRKTQKVWMHRRYIPSGFDDQDPRYLYPEFPHMVGSWVNLGRRLRSGRWVRAFRLHFHDHDTAKRIAPFKGNTIRHSYEATFRRCWPSIHMPRWASRLTLEIVDVKVERVCEISEDDAIANGVLSDWDEYPAERAPADVYSRYAAQVFREQWERDFPDHPWESSWVWVVTFRRTA